MELNPYQPPEPSASCGPALRAGLWRRHEYSATIAIFGVVVMLAAWAIHFWLTRDIGGWTLLCPLTLLYLFQAVLAPWTWLIGRPTVQTPSDRAIATRRIYNRIQLAGLLPAFYLAVFVLADLCERAHLDYYLDSVSIEDVKGVVVLVIATLWLISLVYGVNAIATHWESSVPAREMAFRAVVVLTVCFPIPVIVLMWMSDGA